MPVIYRLFCERCDRESETNVTYDGFAGAVITTDEPGGTIICEGYLAYLDASGSLVTLPHPIENSSLQGQGGTWFNATINGRLFEVTNLICKQCGAINTLPRLKCSTGVGCLTGIILAIATGVLLKLLTTMPVPLIVFSTALIVPVPDDLLARLLKFRHRERVAGLAFKQCGSCGSTDAIPVHKCKGRPMVCSRCQHPTMHITIAGRS